MIQNFQMAIERAIGEQVSYWNGIYIAITKNFKCTYSPTNRQIVCKSKNPNKCDVLIEIVEEEKSHE